MATSPAPCAVLLVIGALCLPGNPALAQPPPDEARWSRFGMLGSERRIRVDLVTGGRIEGAIERFGGTQFTLRDAGGRSVAVERNSISRVTRKSRARGALYGLLIGFSAGFVTGAAAGPYIVDVGNPSAARRVKYGAGWGAFFGGAAAGIGALTGARVTVYP